MRLPLVLASLLFCFAQGAYPAPAYAAPGHAAPVHAAPASAVPGPQARQAARHARKTYRTALIDSLRRMVAFNTVADQHVPFDKNPQHLGFKQLLKDEAARLGFDYADHGYIVIIGLGQSSERVGIITHGDIQPADPAKWKKSPFELDASSEPGRLVGRGTEDDKGPIATALYAMKAIKDQKLQLSKRIELYVYMAEESDWEPLTQFLKTHVPPQMNITLDAEYPLVSAEKGYGTVKLTVPPLPLPPSGAHLAGFGGGAFASQIPEDATALIENATPALEASIRQRAAAHKGMRYSYAWKDKQLSIKALGVSAHSSKPEDGLNALSMLADALNVQPWPDTTAGVLVAFLNDMIGTGIHGEKFGSIAYRDAFMGPLTVAPTVIGHSAAGSELNINLRRPRGKTSTQLSAEIGAALERWQAGRVRLAGLKVQIGEPWEQTNAPHIPVLLSVFSHFTGIQNPAPIAIGGGTNSRLFPSAVSFGPAMPGSVYSGHSEHEFITVKQLMLNLQMYTAVLVELAK